jgi:hypothetical protein
MARNLFVISAAYADVEAGDIVVGWVAMTWRGSKQFTPYGALVVRRSQSDEEWEELAFAASSAFELVEPVQFAALREAAARLMAASECRCGNCPNCQYAHSNAYWQREIAHRRDYLIGRMAEAACSGKLDELVADARALAERLVGAELIAVAEIASALVWEEEYPPTVEVDRVTIDG